MDVHGVSDAERLRLLLAQKEILRKAQSRKGQRPKSTESREQMIRQFNFRHMMRAAKKLETGQMLTSYLPPAYPPSIAPLADLKKVHISDLRLETHHRGSYLLLRAVTPSEIITGILLLAEDEADDVIKLQLYNQDIDSMKHCLAEGSVVVIKEPYLKATADGGFGIRVDHVSDAKFLSAHDDLIPLAWRDKVMEIDISADGWKLKGNEWFNKGNYHLAKDCYSRALESFPSANEAITIKLNRALSHFRAHEGEAALRDLDVQPAEPRLLEKALYRKAQALYQLGRFRECCETHKTLAERFPENANAKSEFSRAIARLAEQQKGKYNFKRMQLEAEKHVPPQLDHATFIGPVIVKMTKSRGRGLFTTDAVKAGDLLLCEKAFAYAFYDAKNPKQDLALLVNTETDVITLGTQAQLVALIAQKVYKNPNMGEAFTNLHHGKYQAVCVSEVDGLPIVDTFLLERTMSLNCFGCPLSSRADHLEALHIKGATDEIDEEFHSCGIWTMASYINHSCDSNARRTFIGDMMIIRATCDIPADTEVTFWYRSPLNDSTDGPSSMAKPMAMEHWGFKCSCIICTDIAQTDKKELKKRKRIFESLMKAFGSHAQPLDAARIESLIAALAETYPRPASEVPPIAVWSAALSLAAVYTTRGDPRKAIEFNLKGLASLGYVIEGVQIPVSIGKRANRVKLVVKKWGLLRDELIGCWMNIAAAYRTLAPESKLADQAEEYARITYRICVGEDETFDDTYSRSSNRTDGMHVRALRICS
ncbi:TPR domain protein [Aspergillus mulundensis]|uniref:SET domain-containing protein n=1 Tax=Aspergillus mulundensis TaxID=1810919 RepID=A0A3D8QN11_9EURO|nr:hypothetical protein DSM5745_10303 [Aspergillus mulundensis]RDW63192.1 hypothetical protein DSM5745_10303 [Aspergillus mulundensis]